ncbi:MAG: hypothetical protein ABWY20_18975 [Mycobacterium sp.]
METNYLTKAQYSAAKARLTRAMNSGNRHRVIAVVDAQYEEWNGGDYAYPDDWHRWERARTDAEYLLRLEAGGR